MRFSTFFRSKFSQTASVVAMTAMLAPRAFGISSDHQVLLRDITDVQGVRDNQLVGYGLVVGLNGTGDRQQTFFHRADSCQCHEAHGSANFP